MGRYTAERKQELLDQIIPMSARGMSYRDIGEEVGVSKNTIMNWIKDEYANRAEHREQDKEAAIAAYQELLREVWRRLELTDVRSYNSSGLINAARGVLERIDKITGAEAPQKIQEVDEEFEIAWDDADEVYAGE